MPDRKRKSIHVRSLVAGRNLEPYVQIVLVYDDGSEDIVTQWTPEEAYHHAMVVLGCIEAANTDAFLVALLTEKLGMPLDGAIGAVLKDFREWRERRRPPEKTQ